MVNTLSDWFEKVRSFALERGGRIIEFGCAFLIIQRGIEIATKTAAIREGIQPPLSPEAVFYVGIVMFATGLAMLLGLIMPGMHDWFQSHGFSRILTSHRFNAFKWRRTFVIFAAAQFNIYAVFISAHPWSSACGAFGIFLMLTYAYLRLGQWMDKEDGLRLADADRDDRNGRINRLDDEGHRLAVRPLKAAATAKAS